MRATVATLEGAYALGVIDTQDPDHLVAARQGSPLVIGLGFGENFIASDVFALLPVTNASYSWRRVTWPRLAATKYGFSTGTASR